MVEGERRKRERVYYMDIREMNLTDFWQLINKIDKYRNVNVQLKYIDRRSEGNEKHNKKNMENFQEFGRF